MRDKYGVANDIYCYPNSDVLINLLDIQDSDTLNKAETEFTAERYRNYQSSTTSLSDLVIDASLQLLGGYCAENSSRLSSDTWSISILYF